MFLMCGSQLYINYHIYRHQKLFILSYSTAKNIADLFDFKM